MSPHLNMSSMKGASFMLVGSLVYPTHITPITEPRKLCRGCISSLRTSGLDPFSLLPHSDPSLWCLTRWSWKGTREDRRFLLRDPPPSGRSRAHTYHSASLQVTLPPNLWFHKTFWEFPVPCFPILPHADICLAHLSLPPPFKSRHPSPSR